MTPTITRWTTIFILLIAAVLLVGGWIYNEATAHEPWDGVYRCEPGSTYTTQECQ